MTLTTYAAYLAEAVATYEAKPAPATWHRVEQLATNIRRKWPAAVLLLPIPPAPGRVRRGRPSFQSLQAATI